MVWPALASFEAEEVEWDALALGETWVLEVPEETAGVEAEPILLPLLETEGAELAADETEAEEGEEEEMAEEEETEEADAEAEDAEAEEEAAVPLVVFWEGRDPPDPPSMLKAPVKAMSGEVPNSKASIICH